LGFHQRGWKPNWGGFLILPEIGATGLEPLGTLFQTFKNPDLDYQGNKVPWVKLARNSPGLLEGLPGSQKLFSTFYFLKRAWVVTWYKGFFTGRVLRWIFSTVFPRGTNGLPSQRKGSQGKGFHLDFRNLRFPNPKKFSSFPWVSTGVEVIYSIINQGNTGQKNQGKFKGLVGTFDWSRNILLFTWHVAMG